MWHVRAPHRHSEASAQEIIVSAWQRRLGLRAQERHGAADRQEMERGLA